MPEDTPTDYRNFLKFWEMCTALACLYVGFMVPFSLGFQRLYVQEGEQCPFAATSFKGVHLYVTRVVDIIVDLIFWADIFFNFLSARWLLKSHPIVHWVLVDDLDEIARLYLKDTFIIDFLGSIPVQYLDCIPGVEGGSLKVARLLRLFKLFRLRRIQTMIRYIERSFP
jgi:hypothetical protein